MIEVVRCPVHGRMEVIADRDEMADYLCPKCPKPKTSKKMLDRLVHDPLTNTFGLKETRPDARNLHLRKDQHE